MITTAYVKIWGELVGAVAWDEQEQLASFEFAPSFALRESRGSERVQGHKAWDLAPIHMPLSGGARIYRFPELRAGKDSRHDTFHGLPGLLADTLPDKYGHQLMDVWLAQQGRPAGSMNPVERLCFIGSRGMGAIEFEPAGIKAGNRSYKIDLDSLVDISQRMLRSRDQFHTHLTKDEEKAMMDILRVGTSAGGARPKAVIAYNEKTGEVRSGQTRAPRGYEHWLLKLDGVSDAQLGNSLGYGRVEMAYYLMAKDCGIDMMESRLIKEHGRAHFMTKRYDREGGDVRHHVQTWCAIAHYDFNDVLSYSYEQLFQTMRTLRLDYRDAEQMYRRMVFNVLARNCDDHTKNFSFIMSRDGVWSLAPAYDICHAYDPRSIWVSQHALSINGKRDQHTAEDLLSVADSMNIKKAKKILQDTYKVISRWDDYAHQAGVDTNIRDFISGTFVQMDLK